MIVVVGVCNPGARPATGDGPSNHNFDLPGRFLEEMKNAMLGRGCCVFIPFDLLRNGALSKPSPHARKTETGGEKIPLVGEKEGASPGCRVPINHPRDRSWGGFSSQFRIQGEDR